MVFLLPKATQQFAIMTHRLKQLLFVDCTGRNAIERHFNRIYKSVLIECHPVNTSHPMVARIVTQWTTMIDDVIIFTIRDMQYGMMSGPPCNRRILLKDLGDPVKRPEWRVGNRVSDAIVRTSPPSFTPHEVVLPVFLEHKRTFHIFIRCHLLIDRSCLLYTSPSPRD